MAAVQTKLDGALLQHGRQQYESTLSDDNRAVRDPAISAFTLAMAAHGFKPVLLESGCAVLRVCPGCQSRHAGRYARGDEQVWGCSHCLSVNEITQATEASCTALS